MPRTTQSRLLRPQLRPTALTSMTSSSDQLDLQAIHDFAVSLAQRAGAMIS